MPYVAKDYGKLVGMEGFSETLLKNHFTLYRGYVANTNTLADALDALRAEGKASTPQCAELKRRFGWEWNGMRLHELYFENLGGKQPLDPASRLGKALAAGFGSAEQWQTDLRASGAMRGIGWVILYQDTLGGRLFNQWVNEHDVGNLAGARPLLVMDVFEHAFMIDYGLNRADYVAAFFKNVSWDTVEARLA